jgi:hypothetical protein
MHHPGKVVPRECAVVPCCCLMFEGEKRATFMHEMLMLLPHKLVTGSTRLRGRSPFGVAKARASIKLQKALVWMDGRVKPGHDDVVGIGRCGSAIRS